MEFLCFCFLSLFEFFLLLAYSFFLNFLHKSKYFNLEVGVFVVK